jgi:hypothetical protein
MVPLARIELAQTQIRNLALYPLSYRGVGLEVVVIQTATRQAADIALDGFSGYPAKDASPPLPTVEVAGVYWDEETGLGCEVQRLGDLLFYRGYGYFPMVAETGYGFSLKGYPEMRLSFTAEAGKVYLLEQPPGSPPASFIRTCPDGEFAFPLQCYEGAYVCSQINAEYRVVTDDGGLRIMSLKNRSAPLRWVGPDRGICSWNECGGAPNWVFSIRFERDAAGGVAGFLLSTARTRRLFFRHIDTATVKSPPFLDTRLSQSSEVLIGLLQLVKKIDSPSISVRPDSRASWYIGDDSELIRF